MPEYQCAQCARTFSMPAHLARHMSASHASAPTSEVAPKRNRKRRRGRPARAAAERPATSAQFDLRGMALEDLSRLITEARAEARARISEIEQAI